MEENKRGDVLNIFDDRRGNKTESSSISDSSSSKDYSKIERTKSTWQPEMESLQQSRHGDGVLLESQLLVTAPMASMGTFQAHQQQDIRGIYLSPAGILNRNKGSRVEGVAISMWIYPLVEIDSTENQKVTIFEWGGNAKTSASSTNHKIGAGRNKRGRIASIELAVDMDSSVIEFKVKEGRHTDVDVSSPCSSFSSLSSSSSKISIVSESKVRFGEWNSVVITVDLRHITLFLNEKAEGVFRLSLYV
eukprot:jgi/Bigna1/81568/fgenesh1_pg.81_\